MTVDFLSHNWALTSPLTVKVTVYSTFESVLEIGRVKEYARNTWSLARCLTAFSAPSRSCQSICLSPYPPPPWTFLNSLLVHCPQEVMLDHALRTVSFIADIGEVLVLMARQTPEEQTNQVALKPSQILASVGTAQTDHKNIKITCHVFQSPEVWSNAFVYLFTCVFLNYET